MSLGVPTEAARRQRLRDVSFVLSRNGLTLAAAVGLLLMALVGALAPWLAPFDPLATDGQHALAAPSWHHLFGTDQLGRDIFSRVLTAIWLDLAIAAAAVAGSFVVGCAGGCIAGYFDGATDWLVSRAVDVIMAFPLFLLAIGIVAALGNTIVNVTLATAIVNVPFYARVCRAETFVRRQADYVTAARMAGSGDWTILLAHVFPNILPPLMVQISLNMGWAILNAAGLSFIGLGVVPPSPELGIMVSEGASFIFSGEWWVPLFPGAVLMLLVLGFNILGDGLRDLVDPERRL